MATKKYEPELKAKIALEAIKNQKSTAEICSEYKIPSTNLYDWRDRVLARLKDLFVEESESARKQRILYQFPLHGKQIDNNGRKAIMK